MSEHEPSGRVAAFEAIVRLAVEEANTSRSFRWRSRISRSQVMREVGDGVSERTVDRALKDAAALGWLTDERQDWGPGERAERFEV